MANVASNAFLGPIDLRIISHCSCDYWSYARVFIKKVVGIASDWCEITSISVVPIVILYASTMVITVEIVIFSIVIFGIVICLVPDFDMHPTAGFRWSIAAAGSPPPMPAEFSYSHQG
jgi:hypothetical protein